MVGLCGANDEWIRQKDAHETAESIEWLRIQVSVEEQRFGEDSKRHFGLECADVDALKVRLNAADLKTDDGRPAPWKRFFVHDPFGNRIELMEPAT